MASLAFLEHNFIPHLHPSQLFVPTTVATNLSKIIQGFKGSINEMYIGVSAKTMLQPQSLISRLATTLMDFPYIRMQIITPLVINRRSLGPLRRVEFNFKETVTEKLKVDLFLSAAYQSTRMELYCPRGRWAQSTPFESALKHKNILLQLRETVSRVPSSRWRLAFNRRHLRPSAGTLISVNANIGQAVNSQANKQETDTIPTYCGVENIEVHAEDIVNTEEEDEALNNLDHMDIGQ